MSHYVIKIFEDTFKGHPIRVYEVNDAWHSAMYTEEYLHNQLVFQYLKEASYIFHLKKDISNLLQIGGGMYSFPRYVIANHNHTTVDVVEIDDKTLEIANDFFFFQEFLKEYNAKDKRLQIYFDDGRNYLTNTNKLYDVIFNDAYDGTNPVMPLLSTEFFKIVKNKLKENGVYIANMPGYVQLKKSKLLLNELKTLEENFRYVTLVMACNELSGTSLINYIVFASDTLYPFENTIAYTTSKAKTIHDKK